METIERLLSTMISGTAEGVFILDDTLSVRHVNAAMEALHADGKPLAGRKCFEAFLKRTGPCDQCPAAACLQSGKAIHERVGLRPDGKEITGWIERSVFPIFDETSRKTTGLVECVRDITQQRKAEEHHFTARKLESLGAFAGSVARDFNGLLTGIITNIFSAKLSTPAKSDAHRLLAEAEKACLEAARLVKELLTFSRGAPPVREVSSIKELIEDTVGFCLSGSDAAHRLELPDDLMAVNIDKGQINQVIDSLLLNARQAMPGEGTITVSAENLTIGGGNPLLLSLKPGNYVKVSIRDEGGGIRGEDLEKIFDPYFTTKSGCVGLGLTVAYSIMRNHGGAITVDSKAGEGSVFSCYLPALEISLGDSRAADLRENDGGRKILVMDADEAVRSAITYLLKNFGYEVHCAASGQEALETYKAAVQTERPFDAVILDLFMPGGIGAKESARLLSEADPLVKTIVASGLADHPIMVHFREHGFSGAIVKPFHAAALVETIEAIIGAPAEAQAMIPSL